MALLSGPRPVDRFLLLAEIGARHGVPIDLHMEAVPAEMALSPGFRPSDGRLSAHIAPLETLLAHDRAAKVVWQHIGWDNNGHMTVELLRRLLAAHPNLFLALRIEERTRSMGGTPMPNRIVDEAWKLRPEWLALFQAFPDRFVIGTDEFFGIPGQSGRAPQSFEETWRILPELPADLARKIGRDNAVRVYGLD